MGYPQKILKTGTVTIEPLKEYQLGGITVSAIRPETTEVNVKVILVGSLYYYEMLKEYDDDFSKLFKMCVLLTMKWITIKEYRFCCFFCK